MGSSSQSQYSTFMPFGRYKNLPVEDVPSAYLQWFVRNVERVDSDVLDAIGSLKGDDRRWVVAFCFGLIHGFGLASVLADLGLPQESLLIALVAFNLGVELGQLVIVGVFLPIAYVLRTTVLYQRVIVVFGSAAIALVALVWLVERAFNLKLIGF